MLRKGDGGTWPGIYDLPPMMDYLVNRDAKIPFVKLCSLVFGASDV